MKKNFISYYVLDQDRASELWKNCVFVLDTSVLLNLYRYPTEVKDEALGIFRKVKERLWIPHQVAIEYQENRLSVIAEQVSKYKAVDAALNEAEKKIKSDLDALQLKKRHSLINPDSLIKTVGKAFGEYKQSLEELRLNQADVFDADKIRDEIDGLFAGRVGSPYSQQEIEALSKQGDVRFPLKRPPGYMDDKKGKGEYPHHLWGDTVLPRKYGDLILWKQILREAATRPMKHVIFLTDDDKEDWWWIVNSQGDKTIGPRPELVQEAMTEGKIAIFYMYNTERFLKYAQDYLGVRIDEEHINKVRETLEDMEDRFSPDFVEAVRRWALSLYPDSGTEIVEYQNRAVKGEADFIVHTKNRERIAFEVVNWRKSFSADALRSINMSISVGIYEASERTFDKFRLIVIAHPNEVNIVLSALRSQITDVPEPASITVGVIMYDDGYPVFEPRYDLQGSIAVSVAG